jgi:hypothetical protein
VSFFFFEWLKIKNQRLKRLAASPLNDDTKFRLNARERNAGLTPEHGRFSLGGDFGTRSPLSVGRDRFGKFFFRTWLGRVFITQTGILPII